MARKPKVVRFRRGPRPDRKWDMGTPPNPRGRSPFSAKRRTRLWGWLLGGSMAAFLFGPVVLDAGSLLWRDSEGCRVWQVVDGDTVRMHCPVQGWVSGRIVGFDTPEMKARCPSELMRAVSATFYLRWQIWTASKVTATPRGRDRYDRVLTLFGINDAPIAERMVRAGLARRYDGGRRQGWCNGRKG